MAAFPAPATGPLDTAKAAAPGAPSPAPTSEEAPTQLHGHTACAQGACLPTSPPSPPSRPPDSRPLAALGSAHSSQSHRIRPSPAGILPLQPANRTQDNSSTRTWSPDFQPRSQRQVSKEHMAFQQKSQETSGYPYVPKTPKWNPAYS